MGTVTSFTAARMLEIENNTLTGVSFIDINGHVLLQQKGGGQIDIGNLKGDRGDPAPLSDQGNFFQSQYLYGSGTDMGFSSSTEPYNGESSPTGSPMILLKSRDHISSQMMTARPGDTFQVEVVAKRVTGTADLDIRASQNTFSGGSPAGTNWYSTNVITGVSLVQDLGNGWGRYVALTQLRSNPDIAKTRVWLQINQGAPYDTTWAVSNVSMTLVANRTPWLNGVNLNNVTAPGRYIQEVNSGATTALNYPAARAGFLEVISDTDYYGDPALSSGVFGQGVGVYQRYYDYDANTGRWWQRRFYSAAWGPWVLMAGVHTEGWVSLNAYLATGITYTADGDVEATPGLRARRVGQMVEIYLNNFVVDSLAVPTSGNIANRILFQNVPSRFCPSERTNFTPGAAGRLWSGYMNRPGTIGMGAVNPTSSWTATTTITNEIFSGSAVFPVGDPTTY